MSPNIEFGLYLLYVFIIFILFCFFIHTAYSPILSLDETVSIESLLDESHQNGLEPTTRVGCPDGLCYLTLFHTAHRPQIVQRLGHFPSILALTSVAKSYRSKARGSLQIIGDGVAHLKLDKEEGFAWEILDNVVARLEFIGGREISTISFCPPKGYGYVQLFTPSERGDLLKLGPTPSLQTIIDIDPAHRIYVKGFLWGMGMGVLEVEVSVKGVDVWKLVVEKASEPGLRIQ
jgi:hypothetical protein